MRVPSSQAAAHNVAQAQNMGWNPAQAANPGAQSLGRLRGGQRPWFLCWGWEPLTQRQLRRLGVVGGGGEARGGRGGGAPGAEQSAPGAPPHLRTHRRRSPQRVSPGFPPSPAPPPVPAMLSPLLDGCSRLLGALTPTPVEGGPTLVTALALGLSSLSLIASTHRRDGDNGGGDADGGTGEQHVEEVSRWLCLLTAVCLLLYHLLCLLDVRRQPPRSPLQMLAQQSTDALIAALLSLSACVCLGLTSEPQLLLGATLLSCLLIYCHHWEVYVTGAAPARRLFPCDPRLVALGVFLVTALSGRYLWDAQLPVLAVPARLALVWLACALAVTACGRSLSLICRGGVGRNGSTVAGTSVISPGFHVGSAISLAAMIAKKSAVGLLQTQPCAYSLTFSIVATKLTCKLVVAHMTRTEMFLLDSAFMGPGLLFLDQYFNSVLCERLVLCLALVLSVYDLARYCVGTWVQVTGYQRVTVMVVTPSKPASRHRETPRLAEPQQAPPHKQHDKGPPCSLNRL